MIVRMTLSFSQGGLSKTKGEVRLVECSAVEIAVLEWDLEPPLRNAFQASK